MRPKETIARFDRMCIRLQILVIVLYCFVGCSSEATITLGGAIEKGPFVRGSTVTVSPLNSSFQPTGQVFTTRTIDDEGHFAVDISTPGFVSIEGTGFYYNEITGGLSSTRLTIRAFYQVTEQQEQVVFLNVLTHLSYDRVQALLAAGETFPDAIRIAEQQVRENLPVKGTAELLGTQLSILSGQQESNYLLGISTLLAQAATMEVNSDDNTDAMLQELINTISSRIGETGSLDQNTKDRLAEAKKRIDTDDVEKKLQARLDSIGSDASIPNLDQIINSDGEPLEQEPLIVLQNQIPEGTCTIIPATPTTPFRSQGAIDTNAENGYLFTPVVQNSSAEETIVIEGAEIKLIFETGLFSDSEFASENLQRLTTFTRHFNGLVEPNGGTASFLFDVIPVELLRILGTKLQETTNPTTINVHVTILGNVSKQSVRSQTFVYPVSVCNGCMTIDAGPCATLTDNFQASQGGECNLLQDVPIHCCTQAGGGKVCPAACEGDGCSGDCVSPKQWWPDCDSDGYASSAAVDVRTLCEMPSDVATDCVGAPSGASWTTTVPQSDTNDCNDEDGNVHPNQKHCFETSHDLSLGELGFDYDCNGKVFKCNKVPKIQSGPLTCTIGIVAGAIDCRNVGSTGWETSVPACGETGNWVSCVVFDGPGTCGVRSIPTTQICR